MLASIWVALVSIALMEFVEGLVWDPTVSNRFEPAMISFLGSAIAMGICVVEFYAYLHSAHRRAHVAGLEVAAFLESDSEHALRCACISLCLVAFMVQPFFTERIAGPSLTAAIVRNICFFNIYGLALYACAHHTNAQRSFGLIVIAFALGKTLGLQTIGIVGDEGRPLSLVVFAITSTVIFCWTLHAILRSSQRARANDELTDRKDETSSSQSESAKDTMNAYYESLAQAHGLSQRECDVFLQIVQGFSQKHVADDLCISVNTVKTHVQSIYRKFGVDSKDQLLAAVKQRS